MHFSRLYSLPLVKGTIFLLFFSLSSFCLHAKSFHEDPNQPWGADANLTCKYKEVQPSTYSLPKKTCRAMIRFFQVYISPIDGPRSSFYPTSSQFALEAIEKYGVFQGIALGCDRLLRENSDTWVYDLTDKYGVERKLDPVR